MTIFQAERQVRKNFVAETGQLFDSKSDFGTAIPNSLHVFVPKRGTRLGTWPNLVCYSASSERNVLTAIYFTTWKKPGASSRLGERSITNTALTVRRTIYLQLLSQPNTANPPCQTRKNQLECNSKWYRNWGALQCHHIEDIDANW